MKEEEEDEEEGENEQTKYIQRVRECECVTDKQ